MQFRLSEEYVLTKPDILSKIEQTVRLPWR